MSDETRDPRVDDLIRTNAYLTDQCRRHEQNAAVLLQKIHELSGQLAEATADPDEEHEDAESR